MLNGKAVLRGLRSAASIKASVWTDFRTIPAPLFMVWEATYRCNLDCPYCYLAGRRNGAVSLLDTARVKKIITTARRMGLFCLVITGGEPLLRDDIFEVRRYASGLGLIVSLTTNGTLIDDSNVDEVSRFDHVTISSDSAHDTCRTDARGVGGAGRRNLESMVNELKRRSPRITINMQAVIDEDNWPHLLDINRRYYDRGVDAVFQLRHGRRFDIGRDRWERMIRHMRYRNALLGWVQRRSLGFFPEISTGEYSCPCLALTSNFVVSPEGDLLPCNYRREGIASLRNGESFMEIWSELGELRKLYSSRARGCTCANTCYLPPAMILS